MRISTTKYNEVNPNEIQRLIDAGAIIIFSKAECEEIGVYRYKGKPTLLCAGDSIKVNGVTLPLAVGGVYDCTIDIN